MLAAWGCDFQFKNATPMFNSMDILVNYLQQQQDKTYIYVKYATLSEYYDALQSVPNVEWPTNYGDDFFPLFESLYWTGYYTSRVALKGIVRQGEAASHVVEPLYSVANAMKLMSFNSSKAYTNIFQLRLANADAQHHDGVTGTAEPGVVQMYESDILNGMQDTYQTTATILSSYISKGQNLQAITPENNLLNIQNGQIVPVVVYNSLGWTRKDFIVLPVNKQSLAVIGTNNKTISCQVNADPTVGAPASFNLFFQVDVPAFGFQTYFVIAGSKGCYVSEKPLDLGGDSSYSNGFLDVTISGTTGRISNITNVASKVSVSVDQNLLAYTSKNSGAYAFGPASFAVPINSSAPLTTVTTGPLVTEIYQIFAEGYAKQNIRLYTSTEVDTASFVELNYTLGPLPPHTEIISRFSSGISNQQLFSTDDNGFEFLLREASYQNPIEANYYPTVYASYIRDDEAQLTLIFDRSHGASSLDNGQLEVMIHRNPNATEYFGPQLTDLDIVYPVTRVLIDSPEATTLQVRKQPYLLNFPLTFFTGAPTSSVDEWTKRFAVTSSFISADLPPNIHLLSLNPLNANSTQTILRFTHMFAVKEDPILSEPVTVDVAALFYPLKITSFKEVTLTANQVTQNNTSTKVQMTCKQIRTFIMEFN